MQNKGHLQGCHTFLIFFTETNNKPKHCLDATKLKYVVFFVLELSTAAIHTANFFLYYGRKQPQKNIYFVYNLNRKLLSLSSQSECARSTIHWFGVYTVLMTTKILCQVWISLRCFKNSFFCQFGKPNRLIHTQNLSAKSYFTTIYMKQLSCSPLTVTVRVLLCPVPAVLLATHL